MRAHLLGLAALVATLGCSSATVIEQQAPAGTDGAPCYANGTCNAGLACVANACLAADATADSTASDAAGDAATEDTTTAADVSPDGGPESATSDIGVDAVTADGAPTDGGTAPYAKTSLASSCDDLGAAFDVGGVDADDSASSKAQLPFSFTYFGDSVTHWSMSSNGFAQLWPSSSGGASTVADNVALPAASAPNGMIAAFWDDLSPVFSNARAGALGNAPNRRFVIAWTHWTTKGETNNRVSFQIKLFETSNVIELHYCGLAPNDNPRANGSSATIGLENLAGTRAVQHAFDVASSVSTGTALRFTP